MFQQCGIICFSRLRNCSNIVVLFVFLHFGTVPTVWYFAFSSFRRFHRVLILLIELTFVSHFPEVLSIVRLYDKNQDLLVIWSWPTWSVFLITPKVTGSHLLKYEYIVTPTRQTKVCTEHIPGTLIHMALKYKDETLRNSLTYTLSKNTTRI
jgi:hypothetical protein